MSVGGGNQEEGAKGEGGGEAGGSDSELPGCGGNASQLRASGTTSL